MFFALNSYGASFSPRFNVRLKRVRFVAQLAKNTVGKFNIYTIENDKAVKLVESQEFTGEGSAGARGSFKYYEASFKDDVRLETGKRYGVSFYLDRLSSPNERSMYQALMFVESGFDTDFASNVWLGRTGLDIMPNIPNNMAPMLEVCRE